MILLGACAGADRASAPASTASKPSNQPSSGDARPRLVVSVVLDQLGSWVLEKYRSRLPANGVLARAITTGAHHPVVRYPYAATITAAGHATLYTGVPPRVHGVTANSVYDYARASSRALVDDGKHAVFGTKVNASPTVLQAETVGDALKRQTGGRAKVVSISIKDRGAVLPGGKKADMAVFYDKSVPGFTTSTYYAPVLPEWLSAWRAAHPIDDYLKVWTPLAETAANPPGPDDRESETNMGPFGRTFPHDPAKLGPMRYSVFRVTPGATRYQLDLAEHLVAQFGLGTDDVPDLLAVSISGTDYVGHGFGAESWEYLDNLLRTDRMLTEFIDGLSTRMSVSVLVTSDHGQARLTEKPRYIVPKKFVEAIDGEMREAFGDALAPYVVAYKIPYVYLGRKVLDSPKKDAVLDRLVNVLKARSDIHLAVRATEGATWTKDVNSSVERLVGESIRVGVAGQVFVVPAEQVIVDPEMGGGGTTHGTPWSYDREVPVLLYGAGVSKAVSTEPQGILQVAPTLAAMLGIEPPAGASASPLAGAP